MSTPTQTAGSLYWLGLRDADGAYLDGAKTYKLSVPQPVPGKLFWSLTVYDAETRSQIRTDQNKAALRSRFERADAGGDTPADLWFGPKAPEGAEGRWIKTIPGKGWFVYFRIYGPEGPAFDGSCSSPTSRPLAEVASTGPSWTANTATASERPGLGCRPRPRWRAGP